MSARSRERPKDVNRAIMFHGCVACSGTCITLTDMKGETMAGSFPYSFSRVYSISEYITMGWGKYRGRSFPQSIPDFAARKNVKYEKDEWRLSKGLLQATKFNLNFAIHSTPREFNFARLSARGCM